jgi:hypothetical protein
MKSISSLIAWWRLPMVHPLAFWLLYSIPLVSFAIACFVHPFEFGYLIGPLWTFPISNFLIHSYVVRSCSDNTGTVFRDKQPFRYWAKFSVWCTGYLFAAFFPLGYAIQQNRGIH